MTRPSALRPILQLSSLVLALVLACASSAVAALPASTGLVTDAANVLDAAIEEEVLATLRLAEQRTGAQIAVATVPSLDGMTIEDYAERLFRTWGIGQKGKDNGVLILVAPSDRKVRIEVGYGLEPVLPDGLAGEIIREEALPAFRSGDFPGGIQATAARVAQIVTANHVLTAEEREALAGGDGRPPRFATTAFFALFITLGALAAGAGIRTRVVFMLLWGGLFGGIPFVMALIPFFNASLLVLVPLAIGAFAVGYMRGGDAGVRASMRGGRRKGKGGKGALDRVLASASSSSSSDSDSGWVMGGSSSSSSGSSSSSSSSFGGGRSGGGGASGSW